LPLLLTLEDFLDPRQFRFDLPLDVLLVVCGDVDAVDLPVLVCAVLACIGDVDVLFSGLRLSGIDSADGGLADRASALFAAASAVDVSGSCATALSWGPAAGVPLPLGVGPFG